MSKGLGEPILRLATLDELEMIDRLMKASTRDLFPNFYDAAQTEASIQYIASVDRNLSRTALTSCWRRKTSW